MDLYLGIVFGLLSAICFYNFGTYMGRDELAEELPDDCLQQEDLDWIARVPSNDPEWLIARQREALTKKDL